MRFYDIGESPLMGHSEKHIAPLVLEVLLLLVHLLLVMLLEHLLSLLLMMLMLKLTVRTISLMLTKLPCSVSGQLICGIVIIGIIRLTR